MERKAPKLCAGAPRDNDNMVDAVLHNADAYLHISALVKPLRDF